ncbi:LysR substrate-binding domain-containing protein [Sphingomonas sp. UYEF23]|uniref:LysR substrate-binding domain-containing protein n=1 Tax=Sphingomonas sp. UYEF23 TaxID=1756408 RepID=UPI003398EEFF
MIPPRSSIKLRQLEYFLAVARTLNFSKAADSIFVTQPTMSHQIAELESQIGAVLFNRNGKAVRLTEAGILFRAYAMRSLAELEAGRHALEELSGLQRGTLRVGVSQSFVRKLLPPILGAFIGRHPAVQLTVTEMTAGQIELALSQSELDLGIAFAPAVLDETVLEPLLEERLMLVMRASHPLAVHDQVAMRLLDGVAMASLSETFSTRSMIDHFLAQAGASPVIACETNSIAVMLGVVASSDVVAIIPEGAIIPARDIRIVQLTDPAPVRVSALLWSRHSFRSNAAEAFAIMLRTNFQNLLSVAA